MNLDEREKLEKQQENGMLKEMKRGTWKEILKDSDFYQVCLFLDYGSPIMFASILGRSLFLPHPRQTVPPSSKK